MALERMSYYFLGALRALDKVGLYENASQMTVYLDGVFTTHVLAILALDTTSFKPPPVLGASSRIIAPAQQVFRPSDESKVTGEPPDTSRDNILARTLLARQDLMMPDSLVAHASNFDGSGTETLIFIIIFTLYVYDWLLSVSEEVKIASKGGQKVSVAIYFLSRIGEFISLLICVTSGAKTLPPFTKHCLPAQIIVEICGNISGDASAYLFLLRVRAVYFKSQYVTLAFGTLWATMAAMQILASASLVPTANSMTGPNLRSRLMSIISGEGLYSLSKSLMRSGQLYYLTTIIAYFVYLGVKTSPALGSSQIALLSGYIAFTNMMACRVFRGVALGGLEDSPTQLGMSSTRIADVLQLGPLSSSQRTDSKVKDDLA
ncbi:hypothetical protein HWV62_14986 [Athelia sp. TMB]|nr:hypothetical protein HWV62_14986 [Athelia sp. TMB]